MSDAKGPAITANRLAMSKALGAAFLTHQVEQLEQKVLSGGGRGGGGNWREGRRTQMFHGKGPGQADQTRERGGNQKRGGAPGGGGVGQKGHPRQNVSGPGSEPEYQRRWKDDTKDEKDADIVVVDASILVHAIAHLKKWCRDGRQEVVIIPLEALNTLDLLKKGTTALAQRARAASRILEAQVGTNPRIRVQQDDAFVLWGDIPFSDSTAPPLPSPEWVRRTICCARWEMEHPSPTPHTPVVPKVILAICVADSDSTPTAAAPAASVSPVPLPAPQPNKFEPRSSGALVLQWANRAGLDVLEVPPSPNMQGSPVPAGAVAKEGGGGGRRSGEMGRRSSDDERGGGSRGSGGPGGRGGGGGRRNNPHQQSKPLVERPPAVMAMMEAVSQPSRVVRVLARGEKLDAN
ncbi:hypothetical protein BC835DRAFT_1275941 [Cytidiella melzeri]|nr:hypothetical protein BC835DRAFT_1275941 [Cytidiella melzeri]